VAPAAAQHRRQLFPRRAAWECRRNRQFRSATRGASACDYRGSSAAPPPRLSPPCLSLSLSCLCSVPVSCVSLRLSRTQCTVCAACVLLSVLLAAQLTGAIEALDAFLTRLPRINEDTDALEWAGHQVPVRVLLPHLHALSIDSCGPWPPPRLACHVVFHVTRALPTFLLWLWWLLWWLWWLCCVVATDA